MSYDSQTAIANRHDFDKTFTAAYEGNQTDLTILTPESGKSLAIKGVYLSCEGGGAAGSYAQIRFTTDEDGNANTVFRNDIFASNSGWMGNYIPMLIRGDRNAPLKLTASVGAGFTIFVLINYKEE